MCWSKKMQLVLALTVTASLLWASEANEADLEPPVSPLFKPWILPIKPLVPQEHNLPASKLNSNVDYLQFYGKNTISEPTTGQEHSQSLPSFAISDNKFIVREPMPETRVPTSHISTAQRPVEVHDSQFGYIQPHRPQQPQRQQFVNIEANRLHPQMPELPPPRPLVAYENAFLQQKKLQPESDSLEKANMLAYKLKTAHESKLIDSKTAEQGFAPQGTLHLNELVKPNLEQEEKLSSQINNNLNSEQKQTSAVKDTEPKANRREDMHITVIIEGPQFNKQNINQTAEIVNSENDSAVNVTVVVRGNGADVVLEEPRLGREAQAIEPNTHAADKHKSVTLKAKPATYDYNFEEIEKDKQKTQQLFIQAAREKRQQTQNILALPACANGVAYLAHPSDCRRFILCINGNALEMECRKDLFWDEVNNVCSENSESCYKTPFENNSEETDSVHSIEKFPFEEQSIEKMEPAYPTKNFPTEEQQKLAHEKLMLNSKPELETNEKETATNCGINLVLNFNKNELEHFGAPAIIMDNQSQKPGEVQQNETESNVKELETMQFPNELLNVAQTDRKTDSLFSQPNVEIEQEIVEEEKSIGDIIVSEGSLVEKIHDANEIELEENKNAEINESEVVSELTVTKEPEMDADKVEDEPEIAKKDFQTFTIIKFVKIDENEQKKEENPTVANQEIRTKEVETDENREKDEEKLETEAVQKMTLTKEIEINENMGQEEVKLKSAHEAVKKVAETQDVRTDENMEKEEKKLETEEVQKLTLTKEIEIDENVEKEEEKLETEEVQKMTLTKEIEIDENVEKEEKKHETEAVQKLTLTKEIEINENVEKEEEKLATEAIQKMTLTKEVEIDENVEKEEKKMTLTKEIEINENVEKEEGNLETEAVQKFPLTKKEEEKLETEAVQKMTLTKEVEINENVEKEEEKLETEAVQKMTLTKEVEINKNMEKKEEKLEAETVPRITLTKEIEIDENIEKEEEKLETGEVQKMILTKKIKIDENVEKEEEKLKTEAVQRLPLTKEVEINENMEKEEKKLQTEAVQKMTLMKEVEIDENVEKEEKKLETEEVQKLTLTKEVEIYENREKEKEKLETEEVKKLTLTKEVEINENMEKKRRS